MNLEGGEQECGSKGYNMMMPQRREADARQTHCSNLCMGQAVILMMDTVSSNLRPSNILTCVHSSRATC